MRKAAAWKIFYIIPILLVYHLLTFSSPNSLDIPVGELLLESLFGRLDVGGMRSFALILEKLYYILFFNLLYGTYIYRYFNVGSEYLFTRLPSRKAWFYRKALQLLGITACYSFVYLVMLLLLSLYRSSYGLDIHTVKLLIFLWPVLTLFICLLTLVINLLAIRYGSNLAFLAVYVVLLLLVTLSLSVYDHPLVVRYPYLLLLNPVSAIIVNMLDVLSLQVGALVYFCLLNGLVMILGAYFINRMDLVGEEHE